MTDATTALPPRDHNGPPEPLLEWVRPKLYAAQQKALFDCTDPDGNPARYGWIEASTKAGKAQPLHALVYTPTGPVRMGDVHIGQRVLIPDGGSARVTGVYPQGLRPIHRLTWSDGAVVEADEEHLWEVHQFGAKPQVVSTRELMTWNKKRLHRAWVPAVQPTAYTPQPVPLDPYLIGILIGDGGLTTEVVRFSSADPQIVDAVRWAIPTGHAIVHAGRHDWRITAGSGAAQLREDGEHIRGICLSLGLGVGSHEKRVPKAYLINSVEVRRAILQGILDTDGFVDKHGQPAIEQTSPGLAEDITELVNSLGGTVLTTFRTINGYKDKAGDFVTCRPVWRQVIRFPDARWCFRLARKAALVRPKLKTGHRFFRTIEPVGLMEAQCIEIDHPRHLYLTDHMVPTHNTVGCMAWLAEQAMLGGGEGREYWWVAPVYAQATIAFRRVRRALPLWVQSKVNQTEMTIELPNGAVLRFRSGEKPDNLYGEDVYAAVVDEASRMREDAWFALRSTLTETRGPVRLIGNVKGRRNWFFMGCRKAETGLTGHAYAKLTAYDAVAGGVLKQEEIDDAKALLPDHIFRELYLAEPSDDGGNPFGLSHIAGCIQPGLSEEKTVCIGVDLAKSVDWTVVIGLDKYGNVTGIERWKNSWAFTRARVTELIDKLPALIDSTGVGNPVTEDIMGVCRRAEGFVFTSRSKQMLMEGLVVAIQNREVGFPDNVIRAELDLFEYVTTRNTVIYSAPAGYHDDCVCALALAKEMHRRLYPVSVKAVGVGGTSRVSPWIGGGEPSGGT